jgi:hypothetical protein
LERVRIVNYWRISYQTSKEILNPLKAVLLSKQIAVIHCPGQHRSKDQVAKGNHRADMAAKEAAIKLYVQDLVLWE